MDTAPSFVAGPAEPARPVVLRAPNAAKGKVFGATAQGYGRDFGDRHDFGGGSFGGGLLSASALVLCAAVASSRRRSGRRQAKSSRPAYASAPQTYEGAPIGPPPDLPSLLLKERIVYLGTPITAEVTELIIAQLLYLNYESADKPITLYLNSTGSTIKNNTRYIGESKVGMETDAFAIADCMAYIKPDIQTICIGQAYGTAAVLLGLGKKGKRFALPNATIMLSEPREPPAQGPRQASDIRIMAKEVLQNRSTMSELLSTATGKTKEQVVEDTNRCYYMTPDEAVEYGLIDKVLTPEKLKGAGDKEVPSFVSAIFRKCKSATESDLLLLSDSIMMQSLEEGSVPLTSSADTRLRAAAFRLQVALLCVVALDGVLAPLVVLSPFSFDTNAWSASQIQHWSFDKSIADWPLWAWTRDVLICGFLFYGQKIQDHQAGARLARRCIVVVLLIGILRTTLLDWELPDAGKIFMPTVAWGGVAAFSLAAASQVYLIACRREAAAAAEQAAAAQEASATETGEQQYSSKLSFFQTLKVLKPYFWPSTGKPQEVLMNRIRASLTWFCVVLSKAFNIISPIYLARATNALSAALKRTSSPQEITEEMWWPLTEYAAMVFFSKALKEAQSLVYIKVQQAAYIEIADNTFAHLHGLSLDWHLRKKMGNVIRSMDRGIQAAQQTMQYVFLYLVPTLIEALTVVLIFIFHFENAQLAVFIFLNLFAYIYATVKVTLWRKQFRTATTKHDNDLHDRITDSLVNYETVKYFTAENYERAEYRSLVEKFQKTSMATQASLSLLNVLQQLIVNFALCGGMIIATIRVLQVHGDLGDFVAVNAYIINVFTPLNFLGTIYNMVVNAIVDMRSFGQLLAETSEVQDAPNAAELNLAEREVPMVSFFQVNFHYSKQPLGRAIKDISFEIPRGGSLALVGATGAGKTTITRLLFRFYDVVSGQVAVNGQDVRRVTQRSLRAAIGMVPQDVVLFNSTISHNLRYGNIDQATSADIEKAAKSAQLDGFIDQQAQGYETLVGERGLKLSGGEKQRLAIARCLVKDPPIVVLDEATSALDSQTEQKIQQALSVLSASRTVVAIAHRLSTIKAYDQICVLDAGQIVESGTHDSLLGKGANYAQMWKRQAAGIMDDDLEDVVMANGSPKTAATS
ncbi:Abcb6 [Symbiodinium sp. CCMP2592]|nr:Abcb6 [Symbiodinium sp. CCMP2592]